MGALPPPWAAAPAGRGLAAATSRGTTRFMPSSARIARCAVLVIGLAAAGRSLAEPPEIELFNGKNLEGWEVVAGDPADWSVVDGVLTCGGNHGWLGTKRRFDNFRLVVEFRLPEGGDSGVFLRAGDEGNPAFDAIEVQLLDDRAVPYRDLPNHALCGAVYALAGPERRLSRQPGEWQSIEIVCGLDRVATTLNGEPVADVSLTKFKDRAENTHPGVTRRQGRIGLQAWGTKAEFRSIVIRPLGGSG